MIDARIICLINYFLVLFIENQALFFSSFFFENWKLETGIIKEVFIRSWERLLYRAKPVWNRNGLRFQFLGLTISNWSYTLIPFVVFIVIHQWANVINLKRINLLNTQKQQSFGLWRTRAPSIAHFFIIWDFQCEFEHHNCVLFSHRNEQTNRSNLEFVIIIRQHDSTYEGGRPSSNLVRRNGFYDVFHFLYLPLTYSKW